MYAGASPFTTFNCVQLHSTAFNCIHYPTCSAHQINKYSVYFLHIAVNYDLFDLIGEQYRSCSERRQSHTLYKNI